MIKEEYLPYRPSMHPLHSSSLSAAVTWTDNLGYKLRSTKHAATENLDQGLNKMDY